MEIKYIDTHAHLNLSAFSNDASAVARQCEEAGVVILNVGTKASTSHKAVELANQHENCYAIIGLHPIQTVPGMHDEDEVGEGGESFKSRGESFDKEFYRSLVKEAGEGVRGQKVIGVGECGYDYWHTTPETFAIQEEAFISQIELANELNLPLMIHTRNPKPGKDSPTGRSVYEDVYETLKQYAKVPFNIHFYAGTVTEAKRFLDIGGTVSFTGVITFAKEYEEVVKAMPLDKIHGETDCPYVAPVPYRGKRCEPQMVIEVYKKIASIKEIDEEVVREQLIQNARTHYSI